MIRRYRLVLNVPNSQHGTWTPVHVGSYRNRERALRAAERILAKHPTEETRYSRERFPWSCSLYDAKRGTCGTRGRGVLAYSWDDAASAARLEAPIYVVPSVGELGWTP